MANHLPHTPWRIVISAYDPRIVGSARRAAEGLRLAYDIATSAELQGPALKRDRLWCLGSRLAAALQVADYLSGFIAAEPHLAQLGESLLDALLLAPALGWTLDDLAGALEVSTAEARRRLRAAGFRHPQHLLATFRARAWEGLVAVGFARAPVEQYLGIPDHKTFRRACGRAGVAVPWMGRGRGCALQADQGVA
jgi:hypothetical protein